MVLIRTHRALIVAWALVAAAPAAAQRTAMAPAPAGWIGFFAQVEERAGDPAAVVVLAVADGSPAQRAGLEQGDALLAVDGTPLTGERLLALQAGLRAGDRLELTVRRAGRTRTLLVRAEPRPSPPAPAPVPLVATGASPATAVAQGVWPAEAAAPVPLRVFGDARTDSLAAALATVERQLVQVRSAESARLRELAARAGSASRVAERDAALEAIRRVEEVVTAEATRLRATLAAAAAERAEAAWWSVDAAETPRPLTPYIVGRDRVAGARVTPLNEGLAEYFGSARGLLIVDVAAGTPAAEAGLRPGDVLLQLGSAEVSDLDALRRAVAGAPADRPLPVTALRKGERVQLSLPR